MADFNLEQARQFSVNAANALRAFEWGFDVLLKAETVVNEVNIQEKALAEILPKVEKAKKELASISGRISDLTKEEKDKTAAMNQRLVQAENDAKSKAAVRIKALEAQVADLEDQVKAQQTTTIETLKQLDQQIKAKQRELELATKAHEEFVAKVNAGLIGK